MNTRSHTDVLRPTCEGCRKEIDPEHCWCGSPMKDHGYFDGHGAIPMGCDCGRVTDSVTEDARRYRFLREPGNAIVYAKDRNAWGKNASGHVAYSTAEQLDAAIDAAIAAAHPTDDLVSKNTGKEA